MSNVQWWLARVDQYGNPELVDGAHSDQSGANQALYLINALGVGAGQSYKVAKVELFDAVPDGSSVNHEAIQTLNGLAEVIRISKKGGA